MRTKTRFDRLPKRDREEVLRIEGLHSSWAASPEEFAAMALRKLLNQCHALETRQERPGYAFNTSRSLLASDLYHLKSYFCDRGIVRRFLDDDVAQLRNGVDTSARLGLLMWTVGGTEYSGECDCAHVFDLLLALAVEDRLVVKGYLDRFPGPFHSGHPATVLLSNGLYAVLRNDRTAFAAIEQRIREKSASRFFRAIFDDLLGIMAQDASLVSASIGEMINGNRRQEQMNSSMQKLICLPAHAFYNLCRRVFITAGMQAPVIADVSTWDGDLQELVQSSEKTLGYFDFSPVNPVLGQWMNELPDTLCPEDLLAQVH